MVDRIDVFVHGRPAPQGSKRYLGTRGGKAIAVESSKALPAWRSDVRDAVAAAAGTEHVPWTGPVEVMATFYMPRPASAPKRANVPATKRPDVDKLVRAVLDAVGAAGLWNDDSQVVRIDAAKALTLGPDDPPGLHLVAYAKDRPPAPLGPT